MNLTAWRMVGAMMVVAVSSACGGSAVGPGDSGTDVPSTRDVPATNDVPTTDDVPTVVDVTSDHPITAPSCSTTPPTAGSGCLQAGLTCSYGDDPNVECRRIARCTEGLVWQVDDPEGCMVDAGRPACPTTPPAAGATCTSSYQFCGLADGTRCICASCPPGGPACTGGTLQWYCDAPGPATCPASPPNLGTACSPEGTQCTYSPCTGYGWNTTCRDGAWQRQDIACAG